MAVSNSSATINPVEERATWLGYMGLLPFLIAALGLWASPYLISTNTSGLLMYWAMYYAAIILSFLGGARWGIAITQPHSISEYITVSQVTQSVIPPLIGWLILIPNNLLSGMAPSSFARFFVLLAAFLLMMLADVRASEDGFLPGWYGDLRRKITMFLTLIFGLILLRLYTFSW